MAKKSSKSQRQNATALSPTGARSLPRTGNYGRLMHRFYEPLILLTALSKTRGPHTNSPEAPNEITVKCRMFRDSLCYLCDFEKGGDTTTAIGVEDAEHCYVFWVAANGAPAAAKAKAHLEILLETLKSSVNTEAGELNQRKRDTTAYCIEVARKRVAGEAQLFRRNVSQCEVHLKNSRASKDDQELLTWLQTFEFGNLVRLCYRAYEQRKAPGVALLEQLGKQKVFAKEARHYLGRLAHHVRAVEQVFEAAPHVDSLLGTYQVRPVPPAKAVLPPSADEMTTLPSIMKRMFPADDARLDGYTKLALEMDAKFDLLQRVNDIYDKCKPAVHCEIQVLDHFYTNKLQHVLGDRYIGCSKPACYLCHLYLSFHPSNPVVPLSHQNAWPNWSPPAAFGSLAQDDPRYRVQREILNRMIEQMRKDALAQLSSKTAILKHPDSATGITAFTCGAMALLSIGDRDQEADEDSGESVLVTTRSSQCSEGGSDSGDDEEGEGDSDSGGVAL